MVELTVSRTTRTMLTASNVLTEMLLIREDLPGGPNLDRRVSEPGVHRVVRVKSKSCAVNIGFNWMRIDWKRSLFVVNYTWSRNTTNTPGAFSIPASGDDLSGEWGPSAGDVRHRFGASFSSSPLANLSLGLNLRAHSGQAHTVTTGRDDNGDGVFNDRPAGTPRGRARGGWQWDLGGRLSYAVGLGRRPQTARAGTQVGVTVGGGSGLAPRFGGASADKRFRAEAYISGQDLLTRRELFSFHAVIDAIRLHGTPVPGRMAASDF
jgi:hypothetical protein